MQFTRLGKLLINRQEISHTTIKIIFDRQQKIHHTAAPQFFKHLVFAIKNFRLAGEAHSTLRNRSRMNCKNCLSKIHGNYCAQCGHAAKLKRIDGHFILHEIEHVLHFEKGLFFTIRELLIRPGKSVREYVSGRRDRLFKPIIFIIVASLIYTLAEHFFNIEKGYFNINDEKAATVKLISNWVHDHYGYANIIMGFFIACWLKIFFRRQDVNIFEIAILLSYVMGIGMLFLAIAACLNGVTGFHLMATASLLAFVYISWAIGQFFTPSKLTNFIKAGVAYVLGFATFSASTWVLGVGYDLMMR